MKSKLIVIFIIITVQIFAQISNHDNPTEPELQFSSPLERFNDGDGSLKISGELNEWHKFTLTLDGPFAHELDLDPYHHQIVIHTHPGEQEIVYTDLLGDASKITGASLQNDWNQTHK